MARSHLALPSLTTSSSSSCCYACASSSTCASSSSSACASSSAYASSSACASSFCASSSSSSAPSSSCASSCWCLRRNSDDDRWLPDDPPPLWRRVHRWAAAAAVGLSTVVLLLLAAAAATTTTMVKVVIAPHLNLHEAGVSSDDVEGVGLLLSGTPLDADMRLASQLAVHQSSQGGIPLLEGGTSSTPKGKVAAFTDLWRAGVRVFVVGGDATQTEVLCRHIKQTGQKALLMAPIADATTPSCGSGMLMSLTPPPAALLAAEVAALVQGGLTHLLPIMTRLPLGSVEGAPLLPLLRAAADQHNVSLAEPIYLDEARPSVLRLRQVLKGLPEVGVWLIADRHLPQLMVRVGGALQGHPVLLHAHPAHLAALLAHPTARAAAEACAATTVQWVGPFSPHTPQHRRLLTTLSPNDPLAAALTYHAATLASYAAANGGKSNLTSLAAPLLGKEWGWGIRSTQELIHPKAAWAARLRLVERQLLGTVVLQDSPWLLEGLSRVEQEERAAGSSHSSWRVIDSHAPARLLAREEVWHLAEHAGCGALARVEVKAHDPLTHRPVLAAWPAHAAPDVLLLPNNSPRGFSVTASCRGQGGREVEVACRGAAAHNDTLSCVVAVAGDGRRRREISNFVSHHGVPTRRYKGGGEKIFFRKLKGLFKHPDFRKFVPQLGACLGSSGGCTFCFVFILSRNVSVSPGVCMGACAVAMSASCGSLLAKGVEYGMAHTVICTELFTQRKLSWESYIADAAYGARLAAKDPRALRGYQLLAGPLVAAMQLSPALTSLVKAMARPWISHMEYEEGMAADDDPLGRLITTLGLPLCSAAAVMHEHFLAVAGLLALTAGLARHARHANS